MEYQGKRLTEREMILLEGFLAVEKFNEIAGGEHNYQTVLNKLKIVLEEVNEALDSVSYLFSEDEGATYQRYLDPCIEKTELLDGVVDILYTVFALPRELEALGYDVFGAFEAVCENNDSKFVKTASEAEMSVRHYQAQGVGCKSVYNEKHNCYSVVNSNGKVIKPLGYKSVVLDSFLPKEN